MLACLALLSVAKIFDPWKYKNNHLQKIDVNRVKKIQSIVLTCRSLVRTSVSDNFSKMETSGIKHQQQTSRSESTFIVHLHPTRPWNEMAREVS